MRCGYDENCLAPPDIYIRSMPERETRLGGTRMATASGTSKLRSQRTQTGNEISHVGGGNGRLNVFRVRSTPDIRGRAVQSDPGPGTLSCFGGPWDQRPGVGRACPTLCWLVPPRARAQLGNLGTERVSESQVELRRTSNPHLLSKRESDRAIYEPGA